MRRSPGLGWCLGRGRLGGMVEIFLGGGGGFWFLVLVSFGFGELWFFGAYDG